MLKTLAVILVLCGALAAASVDLRDVPTKVENGINVTIDEGLNMIYINHSEHYYIIRFPSLTINNINFGANQISKLSGKLNIKNISIYPITKETVWKNNDNAQIRTVEYGEATTKISTSNARSYLAILSTGQFDSGQWGGDIGTYSFDPTVSACGTLNGANSVFTLNQSVSSSAGASCFTFNSTNQTLDCGGFTITGDNTSARYGAVTTFNSSKVLNCIISNFSTGIYFNGAANGNINNSTIYVYFITSGSNGQGINFPANSNNNTISNTYSNNTFGRALYIQSNLNVIYNITAYSLGDDCLYVTGHNNTIYNLTIATLTTSARPSGIALRISGRNNTFSNSTITHTAYVGSGTTTAAVDLLANSNNTVMSNLNVVLTGGTSNLGVRLTSSFNNVFSNISVSHTTSTTSTYAIGVITSSNNIFYGNNITSSVRGIFLSSSSNNSFYNSTISSSTKPSIDITASSSNSFTNNTFIASSKNQILLNMSSTSTTNTFCLNNFTNTSSVYVSDPNGSNYYNCTYDGVNQGNIWYNVINGSINVTGTANSSFSGVWIGSAGVGATYNNSSSSGKFLCNFDGCADFAPLTTFYGSPPEPPSDSCTYSGSGNWVMNYSHMCNITTSVDIGANYLILNGGSGKATIKSGGAILCKGIYMTPATLQGSSIFAIEIGGRLNLIK